MGIKIKILDVLCLSFLIQLVIFPQDASSISFILSYLALFGILTIGKLLNPFFIRILGTNPNPILFNDQPLLLSPFSSIAYK
jgi:predicted membrane metal-binding protein